MRRIILINLCLFLGFAVICFAGSKFTDIYYPQVAAEGSSPADKDLLVGLSYLKENNLKKAAETLEQYQPDKAYKKNYRNYLLLEIALKDNQPNFEKLYHKYKINDAFLEEQLDFEIAENYFENKNYESSEAYFKKVINNDYQSDLDQKGLLKLFEISQNNGETAKSKKYLAKLLIMAPDSLDYFKEVGLSGFNLFAPETIFSSASDNFLFCQKLYQAKKISESIYYLERFKSKYPDFSKINEVSYFLGLAYYLKGNYEQAIICLESVKEKPLSNTSKAIFYLARSFEELKNYEKTKENYLVLINDYPFTEFAPQAYYRYYLLTKAENPVAFDRLAPKFKSNCATSEYYNQYIWDAAFENIKSKNYNKAAEILNNYSEASADLEDQAKIVFWQGKIQAILGNKETAKIKFKECISKFPFCYYTYRIVSQYLTDYDLANFSRLVKDLKKPLLDKFQWLHDIGLNGLAIQELENRKDQKQGFNLEEAYTLSTLYFLDQKYYAGLKTFSQKLNVHAYFKKNQGLPKAYLELLYPVGPIEIIKNHSSAFNKEPALILSVIRRESAFRQDAYSRSNAIGLMQIMPKTGRGIANDLAELWLNEKQLEDKNLNVKYGTFYLTYLANRFNNNYVYMLSAYNAGPNRTQKWITEFNALDLDFFVAQIPYEETRKYIPYVLENYWIYKNLYKNEKYAN